MVHHADMPSEEIARERVVELFREYLEHMPLTKLHELLDELFQYDSLACWCKDGEPCHADVWIEFCEIFSPRKKVLNGV